MSDSQANKAVVRRFLGAIESGDADVIEALQAPDCDWWVIGGGELSRQSYNDQVRAMLLAADRRTVEIIGMVAEGNTVTCEVRSEIHFGDRVYRNEYHDLFRLRDGLIVHGREYFDTGKVAAFLGTAA